MARPIEPPDEDGDRRERNADAIMREPANGALARDRRGFSDARMGKLASRKMSDPAPDHAPVRDRRFEGALLQEIEEIEDRGRADPHQRASQRNFRYFTQHPPPRTTQDVCSDARRSTTQKSGLNKKRAAPDRAPP